MSINTLLFFSVIFFVVIFCVVYLYKKTLLFLKEKHMITNYAEYKAILQMHMERAYDIIHKENILIYSLEATRLPDKEVNEASKQFIILVEKLLGSRLLNKFIFMHGSYETFIFNLAEYFSTRYEEDEIRKGSMDDMMGREDISEE